MTETLFERYKEALRAGHVAAVRGRLEEAVAAYREAGAIAPDRTVPRTALGAACLRLGDPEAALEAYDAALVIAPDDDAATIGRAQALVVLRRTADAAAAYDRLADIRAAGERPGDAAEAARRALAIEPTDARRARHADLVEVLRTTAGWTVAAGADLDAGSPIDRDAVAAMRAEGDAEAEAGALGGPDPEELVAELEDAIVRGDTDGAAVAALAAARTYRALGHLAAAFDACFQGIGARPADAELHLLLADMAVERGWGDRAADTYRNLLRLADLEQDQELAALVRTAAAARLPDDPRSALG